MPLPLKKGFCVECGCERYIANAHFSLCLAHNQQRLNRDKEERSEPVKGPRTPKKERKPIAKRSGKKIQEIKDSNVYYAEAIRVNTERNKGVCRCDECGAEIKSPGGRNVAHLVSQQRNPALYLDPLNHFILGKGIIFQECDCLNTFDNSGKRSTMKLFPEFNRRRVQLLREHYLKEK